MLIIIHQDIICNDIKISCKSGKQNNHIIHNEKVSCLDISSFRLGRFQNLKDQVDYCRQHHEDCFIMLNYIGDTAHKYNIYYLNREDLNIGPYNMWDTVGLEYRCDTDIRAKIIPKMSHQLWMWIPIDTLDKITTIDTNINLPM